MVPCEQKNTTKQVKKSKFAATSVFFIPPPFFFQNAISFFLLVLLSQLLYSPAGPRAAYAQVLHPTEVRLHRQALLL